MNAEVLAPLIALLGLGTLALVGLRMFLTYRIKRFQARGGGVPSPELEDGLAELRDQVHLLRGDLTELQERVDFTERVLARGRDGAKLAEGN